MHIMVRSYPTSFKIKYLEYLAKRHMNFDYLNFFNENGKIFMAFTKTYLLHSFGTNASNKMFFEITPF